MPLDRRVISPPDAATSLSTLVVATGRDYGWTEAPLDPCLASSRIESPRGRFDAVCHLLTRGDRRVLLAEIRPAEVVVPVLPTETSEDLFRRYLDVSLLERLALWGLARPAGADSLLCVTPDAARLLDARREVAWADLAGPDVESVHAILRRLETPPGADSAALANELRRWTDLNAGPLGRALHWGRSETERLLRQAILGLRRLAASPNLEPLGLTFAPTPQAQEMQARRPHHNGGARVPPATDNCGARVPPATGNCGAGVPPATGNCGAGVPPAIRSSTTPLDAAPSLLRWAPEPPVVWLDRLLAAAQEFAPSGAGAWSPLERRALERQLAGEDGQAACEALRDSLLRLARVRISAPVLLRLLLPAEPELTAWRLALTQPLQVRDELPSADLYVFAPLRLDPRECGMGRVLEAYEKLARHAAREMRELARAGGRQLDLFAAGEPSVDGEPPRPIGASASTDGGPSHHAGVGEASRGPSRLVGAGESASTAAFGASSPFDWVCRHALRIVAPPEPALRDAMGYLIALHTLDVPPLEEADGSAPPAPLEALTAMFEA